MCRQSVHCVTWVLVLRREVVSFRPGWWHSTTRSVLRIKSAIWHTGGNIDPFAIIFRTSSWIIVQLLFSQQRAEGWHHLYNGSTVNADVTFLVICAFLTAHWAFIEFDNSVSHMTTFRKRLLAFPQNKCSKKSFYLVHCSFIWKWILPLWHACPWFNISTWKPSLHLNKVDLISSSLGCLCLVQWDWFPVGIH